MAKKLKLTQVRSVIGSQEKKHKRVMTALGFRKNYRTLYKNDTPEVRGMLRKVSHLVACEEIDEKDIPAPSKGASTFTVLQAPAAGSVKPGTAGESAAGADTAGEAGASGEEEE
jgi:large subunit ribosomal protein L30